MICKSWEDTFNQKPQGKYPVLSSGMPFFFFQRMRLKMTMPSFTTLLKIIWHLVHTKNAWNICKFHLWCSLSTREPLSPGAIIFKNSFQLSILFLKHYNNIDSWSMVRFLLDIVHEFKQMLLKPFIAAFKKSHDKLSHTAYISIISMWAAAFPLYFSLHCHFLKKAPDIIHTKICYLSLK